MIKYFMISTIAIMSKEIIGEKLEESKTKDIVDATCLITATLILIKPIIDILTEMGD